MSKKDDEIAELKRTVARLQQALVDLSKAPKAPAAPWYPPLYQPWMEYPGPIPQPLGGWHVTALQGGTLWN